jgi:hypothetical protein
MTKLEQYMAKAAESLAATEAATTASERAFHHRAHSIYRRLIAGAAEAEERTALNASRSSSKK